MWTELLRKISPAHLSMCMAGGLWKWGFASDLLHTPLSNRPCFTHCSASGLAKDKLQESNPNSLTYTSKLARTGVRKKKQQHLFDPNKIWNKLEPRLEFGEHERAAAVLTKSANKLKGIGKQILISSAESGSKNKREDGEEEQRTC